MDLSEARPRGTPARPTTRGDGPPTGPPAALPPGRALLLPAAFAAALLLLGLAMPRQQLPELFRAVAGAGALGLVAVASALAAFTAAGRRLSLQVTIHRHHWVQACAQATVLLYWGWHIPFVYGYLPLILAQLLFAYVVDALLTWSRRDTYSLGFGPFPIIGSINLFLWFRPEHFHWQFVMILVGFLAKELIRWQRDGRSSHVFNPSSFPLAIAALVLILTGRSDLTLASQIVTSQFNVPGMYLVIFLASLPGQVLFGVARMTMSAVVTLVTISAVYFAATGTYLFLDAHVPVPVFLGMHLLFTDPSTSPRRGPGRLLFGALYAAGVAAFFVVLSGAGAPTYFDKLLPLPILNLLARRIDALTTPRAPAAASLRRNLAYTGAWAAVFAGLLALRAVGDRHPGQYLPFWETACEAGEARACSYVAYRQSIYCARGSGWACNEWGVRLASRGASPREAFSLGCRAGSPMACENLERGRPSGGGWARGRVPVEELPIVLSWKGRVEEREPAALLAMACEQGWAGACRETAPQAVP